MPFKNLWTELKLTDYTQIIILVEITSRLYKMVELGSPSMFREISTVEVKING